jgi:hypothetical protein
MEAVSSKEKKIGKMGSVKGKREILRARDVFLDEASNCMALVFQIVVLRQRVSRWRCSSMESMKGKEIRKMEGDLTPKMIPSTRESNPTSSILAS